MALTDNPRERLKAKLLRLLSRHQNKSRSTVVQARRVSRRDGTPVLFERGVERGDLLVDDALILFVLAHDRIALLALDNDRCDFRLESTVGPRLLRTLVGRDGVRIHGLTADTVLLSGVLATVAHRELVVHIPKTVGLEGVLGRELAEHGVLARKEEAGRRRP